MIRIAQRSIDPKKRVRFALSIIKGIGKSNVKKVIEKVYSQYKKSSKDKNLLSYDDFYHSKLADFSDEVIVLFRSEIENNYLVESNLIRQQASNINILKELGTWRGKRHAAGMPVRGQQTRTNSRTVRGNKRNPKGSGRNKAQKK